MHRGEGFFGRANARFIVALIALLSFTAQSYVVQTHIHAPGAMSVVPFGAGHKAPAGGKDNQDDCPICQAFATTGAFITPALIILALALTFIDASPVFALRATAGPVLTRNWRSRAPPQH
jgi:hypothetical protein